MRERLSKGVKIQPSERQQQKKKSKSLMWFPSLWKMGVLVVIRISFVSCLAPPGTREVQSEAGQPFCPVFC